MKTILSALGLSLLVFTSCGGQKKAEVDFIQDNIDNAVAPVSYTHLTLPTTERV